MKKAVGIMLIVMLALTPTLAFAASPWTQGANYSERVGQKLQFGLTNTLLGWVDLFVEPNKAASAGGNTWAGVGKGLTDSVLNTVGGALHLVTFPIPVDIPLPDDGVQLK